MAFPHALREAIRNQHFTAVENLIVERFFIEMDLMIYRKLLEITHRYLFQHEWVY